MHGADSMLRVLSSHTVVSLECIQLLTTVLYSNVNFRGKIQQDYDQVTQSHLELVADHILVLYTLDRSLQLMYSALQYMCKYVQCVL